MCSSRRTVKAVKVFCVVFAFAFFVVPCFSSAISIIELKPDYDYDIDEGSYGVAGSDYGIMATLYNHSFPDIDYNTYNWCPHCLYQPIAWISDSPYFRFHCSRCNLYWHSNADKRGVRTGSPQHTLCNFSHSDLTIHDTPQWLRYDGRFYEEEHDRYRYFFYCPYEGCDYEHNVVGFADMYIHPNSMVHNVNPEPTDTPEPTDEPEPTVFLPTMPPLTPFPDDDYSFSDIGDDFSETSSSFADWLRNFGNTFAGGLNTFRTACNSVVNYFTSSEFGNGLLVTIFFFSLIVLILYNWFIRSS